MGLRLKFNLVLLAVFVTGLGVTGYVSYELLHRNAREEVLRNAGVMMEAALSNLALALNLIVLMAVMAGFHATLTLPGIAGIALTVGMAVDTNILIFERIREELRAGKTVRAAIDAGFSRAFRTVIDTHVTVLVSGLILYQFGTGPVKGFAVSLMIGIAASLFTAVFFTRLVFDLIWMGSRRVASLSI